MKKALTFLAVSTLSLASVADIADHDFGHRGGGGHHMAKPSGGHGLHGGSHGPAGSHGLHGSHGNTGHTSHTGGHHDQHHQKSQSGHYPPGAHSKQDGHKQDQSKKTRPEKDHGKSTTTKNDKNGKTNQPGQQSNNKNPNAPNAKDSQSGGGGGGMDLKPLFDIFGNVVHSVVDKMLHHGKHGGQGQDNSPPTQQTLAADTYSIGELESFFEHFKKNKSGLNKSYDDAWAEWQKVPHQESSYKSNTDKYTVHELGTFFDYMKKNQNKLPGEFLDAWDQWDAIRNKGKAHDNTLFHLHDILKEGKNPSGSLFRGSSKQ